MVRFNNQESIVNVAITPQNQEVRRQRFIEKYKKAFNTELEVIEKQNKNPNKVVVNVYGVKSKWM
ncbi:hypothetical protein [Sporosarcina sp. HYO08]|uniref:hypothetical protein n=1 Tax=Sporosarcina sp. HYO08 TaxID=1759557 RepID=UPI000791F40A|nr:hypothetical protein [Sporosarcina sp. HYO08]KXH86099.1 hypothetical protein AU377_14615 [Sporosarcina sp. HYO08]